MATMLGAALVHAPTRLEGLKRRWGTAKQAAFLLEQAHVQEAVRREPSQSLKKSRGRGESPRSPAATQASFDDYENEDAAYRAVLERVENDLDGLGFLVHRVERSFLANFDFEKCFLVVVVGQDGLVANAAKYVGDLPVVAINPDPARIDGVLLPFAADELQPIVRRVMQRKFTARSVTLAEANLNDGQRLLAFNDFFIGAATHVSARYVLETPERAEPQSSSGIIVATGAGSTGWMSSVFNMAGGVARFLGGETGERPQLAWEDRQLLWAVREPFVSKRSQASLTAGRLHEGESLVVESLMPENGVIFSDGVEADFLPFTSGGIARIGVSQQRAVLVVG